MSKMKKCLVCEEIISVDALRCPHCTSRLSPSLRSFWHKQFLPMVREKILLLILLLALLFFFKSCSTQYMNAVLWIAKHMPTPKASEIRIGQPPTSLP